MKFNTVGNKLYISVVAVFILFATAFMIFQQVREKQYKIDTLNTMLQDYNNSMSESLRYMGMPTEQELDDYVSKHPLPGLRVTLVNDSGRVTYDSQLKRYDNLTNHNNRPELKQARAKGTGSSVERNSTTLRQDFFYSATYFKNEHYFIRTALPYDDDLVRSLQTDQHYIWFALSAMALLTLILHRFTHRLDDNIDKLKIFANRVAHNESLDTEELAAFPNDELGEIAERIIKIYKRLEATRQEQDRLKRELTQNIAHELKTPVAGIQGYLETILDNPHIDEHTKQLFLQRCFAQSQRLTSLLQDISTLNRMDDAPDIIGKEEEVDISATVATIAKETVLQTQEHNMVLENNLPSSIIVHGNQSLIYSVFRNLIDNAIAYAGNGTTMSLSATEEEEEWLFTFSDNGVGVPAEHLGRLFERFYRIDKGRSRKMGGTGLGLAIVKNAVLLHGGKISVDNAPGGGLRFMFSLRKQA
ncbi:MAG: sensor histidine kinase [Prevotella sp.]